MLASWFRTKPSPSVRSLTCRSCSMADTISAALAVLSARAGKRTLVCELNADERISRLLGATAVGPRISWLEENLWAVNVRPQEAMREYALMLLKLESIYKAVFENRFVRYFLRFIPSLQELVMLGKILYHLREKLPDGEPRFEVIVMDAPATGHAISFLSVPRVIIDTVPPGAMAREAKVMRDLLEDEKTTAAVLVSLPEEMPVNETIELCGELRSRIRVNPRAVVLNSFTPSRFTEADLKALSRTPSLLRLAESHNQLAQSSAQFRRRLESELHLPLLPIPRLSGQKPGRESIESIASHLEPMLKGER